MACTASSETSGNNHRTSGPTMREEREKDNWSLEAEKITHIQTSTGSQRPMSDRIWGTKHGTKGLRLTATANMFGLRKGQGPNHNRSAC